MRRQLRLAAQPEQLPVEGPQLGPRHVVQLAPGEAAAVVGVAAAVERRLVAVVDAGGAGVGHQEGRRRTDRRQVTAGAVPDAGDVVGAQGIHQHLPDRPGIVGQRPLEPTLQAAGGDGPGRAVEVLLEQPQAQRRGEAVVVHDAVPLVAHEPRRRVPEELAQDEGLGIDLLDGLPEGRPDGVVAGADGVGSVPLGGAVEADLLAHVQAPAVDGAGRLEPRPGDGGRVVVDLRPQRRVGVVQLRHGVEVPPEGYAKSHVLLWGCIPIREGEITVPRRRLRFISARGRPLVGPVEPGVPVAAVVEHAVEHEPDGEVALEVPVAVGRLSQAGQGVVAAEVDVHGAVVHGVVLVVGGRAEDGIQVDGVDAEVLQVGRQAPGNARQVAAEELLRGGARIGQRPPGARLHRPVVVVLAGDHVVGRVAVGETVGEDLVPGRPRRPRRRVEAGHQPEIQPGGLRGGDLEGV